MVYRDGGPKAEPPNGSTREVKSFQRHRSPIKPRYLYVTPKVPLYENVNLDRTTTRQIYFLLHRLIQTLKYILKRLDLKLQALKR